MPIRFLDSVSVSEAGLFVSSVSALDFYGGASHLNGLSAILDATDEWDSTFLSVSSLSAFWNQSYTTTSELSNWWNAVATYVKYTSATPEQFDNQLKTISFVTANSARILTAVGNNTVVLQTDVNNFVQSTSARSLSTFDIVLKHPYFFDGGFF
jgi:hypothetical protein